jgi:hypothetical protein
VKTAAENRKLFKEARELRNDIKDELHSIAANSTRLHAVSSHTGRSSNVKKELIK